MEEFKRETYYRKIFNSFIEKYGMDKVLSVVERLEDDEQGIIKTYIGINGKTYTCDDIAKILKVSSRKISQVLRNRTPQIEEMLENEKIKYAYSKKDKFYASFVGYSEEEVNRAIARLNESDRNILCLCYGIDTEKGLMQKEIAELYNASKSGIYYIVKKSTEMVRAFLENPDMVYSHNDEFRSMFADCSKEELEFAFSNFSDKTKQIYFMYYGLENEQEMNMKEIASKFNVSISYVNIVVERNNKTIRELVQFAREDIREPLSKYDDEEIKYALNLIDCDERKVIRMINEFDDNKALLKKISEEFGVSLKNADRILKRSISNLTKVMDKERLGNKKKKTFEEMFGKYDLELVGSAIDNLEPREKAILCSYYGLDGSKYKSMGKIAQNYDVTSAYISLILKNSVEKMHKMLTNEEYMDYLSNKKEDRYSKAFSGIEFEEVSKALIMFSEKYQDILSKYYGVGNKGKTSIRNLAREYGVEEEKIKALVEAGAESIKRVINNGFDSEIEYYITKYGLDNFKAAINDLSKEEKNIISRYYGINGYKKHSITEIADLLFFDDRELFAIVNDIKDRLENGNLKVKKKKEELLIRKKEFKNSLIVKEKRVIDKALSFLSDKEFKAISMYYGFNDKLMNIEEIAECLDIEEKVVADLIKSGIKRLNKYLENESNKKR